MSQMIKMLKAKGAEVKTSGVINWSSKKREQQIDDLVDRFSSQYDF
ncbi:hypothetical protein [Metaplanococcus flavidus]|uniref:Uncharacterized protein n=1 Tax=Metaplanococcus flavidus TaxID=569883 RepID=A0ABW3LE33_9BACL